MMSALAHHATEDGDWFGLRERFAHLGLAQGFDELLCMPHLNGVEPLVHQIETVRKVLKQFRGRVLLETCCNFIGYRRKSAERSQARNPADRRHRA
jgi:hypothetical protein